MKEREKEKNITYMQCTVVAFEVQLSGHTTTLRCGYTTYGHTVIIHIAMDHLCVHVFYTSCMMMQKKKKKYSKTEIHRCVVNGFAVVHETHYYFSIQHSVYVL